MKKLPPLNNNLIDLDTNIFIYYLNQNSTFYPKANNLFKHIIDLKRETVTSVVTLIEVLSLRAPETKITQLEKELLMLPKLRIIDLNLNIGRIASRIRREYRFGLADSVQIATALHAKAKAFITNDEQLKKFKEIKIILLDEL